MVRLQMAFSEEFLSLRKALIKYFYFLWSILSLCTVITGLFSASKEITKEPCIWPYNPLN